MPLQSADGRRSKDPVLKGAIALTAVVLAVAIFIVPNHPPRPRNVPDQATLISKGLTHYWQQCWFNTDLRQDQCRIYSGGGVVLLDEAFLDEATGTPAIQEELEIAGGGGADSVHLKNGKILVPSRLVEAPKPGR